MSTLLHKHLAHPSTTPAKFKKRWHLAFTTIYCSRTLLSIAKNTVEEKIDSKFSRSKSYTAIDVEPETNHFSVDKKSLSELVKEENLEQLKSSGGVEGVVEALKSSAENGINGDHGDILNRQGAFGSNTYERPPPKSLFNFVLKAFKDPTIIVIGVCAAFSLGFGITNLGLTEGWRDGGSLFLAVSIFITVSSVSNYWPNRQFNKLSQISDNIKVCVVRNKRRQLIPIDEIVVGDVVCLKNGDIVPADGLLLDGHSLQVDKSSLMGNTDQVEVNSSQNPFLHSGSMVADGNAQMLVTSVGMNATWSKLISAKWQDSQESTSLQAQLNKITSLTGIVGLLAGLLVFVVWLVRYFMGKMKNGNVSDKTGFHDVASYLVGILAAAVAIALGTVADGLTLAAAVTLAYSMTCLTNNRVLVRKFSAFETSASATTICTKLNQRTVTEFWIGQDFIEGDASSFVAPNIIELLHQGIGLSTTQPPSKASSFIWTPTEKSIIYWAIQDMNMNMNELKESCSILHDEAFDPMKTRGGFLMRKNTDNTIHVHWKGTSEVILAMCSQYYETTGKVNAMDCGAREKLKQIHLDMAADGLLCVAFAHKKITRDPFEYGMSHQMLDENCLTLLGLIGVKDPCQTRIKKAVEDCHSAGVNIKMVTRDSTLIARAIATECGILKPNQGMDSELVEALEFRNYTQKERMEKVDKISVIARGSPLDMLLMVQCLKEKGHVVMVTGDDTVDAAALREADIGVSMGFQATGVAKESSDIVILDDDFVSVVNVLKWGRTMFNSIQIFTQFQLTVCITSLVIDFVPAVSAREPPTIEILAAISSGEVPVAALQLLWVKLIMGTLAALALARGQPSKELMKHPVDRNLLITNIMWRNILAQATYHIAILLTLKFKGKAIFGVNDKVKDTLVFNTSVLCLVFNKFNERELKKKNIFKRIRKSKLFLSITGGIILLQIMMVEFLKRFAGTERLNWGQWGASIGIAAMSWPLALCVKWIPVPNKPFLTYLKWKN